MRRDSVLSEWTYLISLRAFVLGLPTFWVWSVGVLPSEGRVQVANESKLETRYRGWCKRQKEERTFVIETSCLIDLSNVKIVRTHVLP